MAEAAWVFSSVATFCISELTSLMTTSVHLKLVVKCYTMDLLSLSAKEMFCNFKRAYILPFCGGEMSICYTSPSVKSINQGMIYTKQMIDYRRKYPVLSAFVQHSILFGYQFFFEETLLCKQPALGHTSYQ